MSARTRWTIAQGSTGESGVAVTIVLAGLISGSRARWYDVEQPPAFGGSDFAAPVAEEPVVTDTLQSTRQHVRQEAADELRRIELHHALCGFMAVALTALIIFTRLAQESKQVSPWYRIDSKIEKHDLARVDQQVRCFIEVSF